MKVAATVSMLKKNAFFVFFSIGVFVALSFSINFHTDGSSVAPGNYSICISSSSDDIFGSKVCAPHQVFLVKRESLPRDTEIDFTLVFLIDKKYYIEDEVGNRLTPQGDKLIMAVPSTENPESQQWEIQRWNRTAYFTIINVESHLSLHANKEEPLRCDSFVNYSDEYLFMFPPIS